MLWGLLFILAPQMYNKGELNWMNQNPNIDEQLRQAYQNSEYTLIQPDLKLKIDVHSKAMDTFLIDNNCHQACMITAYNPRSEQTSEAINLERQTKLLDRIKAMQKRPITASSKDPLGKWPIEDQVFVLDLEEKTGMKLAREFEQNAFLYLEIGQPAKLVWT